MKIVTVMSAAEAVGWDYTFETTLLATGPVSEGVLHGDLVVTGTRTYEIVGVEIFPLTLGLLLLYKTQDTESAPPP